MKVVASTDCPNLLIIQELPFLIFCQSQLLFLSDQNKELIITTFNRSSLSAFCFQHYILSLKGVLVSYPILFLFFVRSTFSHLDIILSIVISFFRHQYQSAYITFDMITIRFLSSRKLYT